jgi:drug/metabolite transporter (DMT)-like permease
MLSGALRHPAGSAAWWPALALAFNAFTWGVSWWPFRQLQAQGLHPLWATVLIYSVVVLGLTLARPHAWGTLLRVPALWVLVLAAGTTNAAFNWAVTLGDVVRVILLFYLMPLWAVGLARGLLGERITAAALARVALALAGAAVVLWPEGGGWPMPRNLAEGLAVLGGFSFALNNVMLRREAHRPKEARALAMFLGGAVVSGLLALAGAAGALPVAVPAPPAPAPAWLLGVAGMALWFLLGNLMLQYGAARLPAAVTAVVLITEVPIAAASAVLLGAGTLSTPLLVGGALIVSATLLAARAAERPAADGVRPEPQAPP